MPIVIMVEAYTAYEAAARGLDEIIRQGGRITVIKSSSKSRDATL